MADHKSKVSMHNLLNTQDKKIVWLQRENDRLESLLEEHEKLIENISVHLSERDRELGKIVNSRAWRLALFLRGVHEKLLSLIDIVTKSFGADKQPTIERDYLSEYKEWILANEPNKDQLKIQRKETGEFRHQPFFFVFTLVENSSKNMLDSTIHSLIAQTYEYWELYFYGQLDNAPAALEHLKKWQRKDRRIRVVISEPDFEKVFAVTDTQKITNDDFIAFLDQDIFLAPFAFFEFAKKLNQDPEVDLIYSDEDKITEATDRFLPFFKPDFSPDTLRSENYIGQFFMMQKMLGDQVGWIRKGFDGAEHYDLILRAVEKARKVAHITKIIWHCREAQDDSANPLAHLSGKKALQEHIQRLGLSADILDGPAPTLYRVKYHFPEHPLVSIIIPSKDNEADLLRCIESILYKSSYQNFEIIVVENNSQNPNVFRLYTQLQEMDKRITVIEWGNEFNFSSVNNWAVEGSKGKVLLFLNNDTEVITPDWLDEMLRHALRPDIGVVGAKLYFPTGNIQHAGLILGMGGVAGHEHYWYSKHSPGFFHRLFCVRNVSAVTGACLMVRRNVFEEVNGFNNDFVLAYGDVDLCLRVREKGYLNLWTPYAKLHHYESKTRGSEDTLDNQTRFQKEEDKFKALWANVLQRGDPYYNPNLTLSNCDFSLRLPEQNSDSSDFKSANG